MLFIVAIIKLHGQVDQTRPHVHPINSYEFFNGILFNGVSLKELGSVNGNLQKIKDLYGSTNVVATKTLPLDDQLDGYSEKTFTISGELILTYTCLMQDVGKAQEYYDLVGIKLSSPLNTLTYKGKTIKIGESRSEFGALNYKVDGNKGYFFLEDETLPSYSILIEFDRAISTEPITQIEFQFNQ